MEKFEYKILSVNAVKMRLESFQPELMRTLNDLGGQGWELISAEGLNGGYLLNSTSQTMDVIFLFKRKRQDS